MYVSGLEYKRVESCLIIDITFGINTVINKHKARQLATRRTDRYTCVTCILIICLKPGGLQQGTISSCCSCCCVLTVYAFS